MGPSWSEVHEVFLMHAADGVYARLHQQGKMPIGTKAPIGHQDITGAQLQMGGVSNADIDGNNTLYIKVVGVTISTFETLPGPDPPHPRESAQPQAPQALSHCERPDPPVEGGRP